VIKGRFFIHLFCTLAIISAAISPACAFISGKAGDVIEICSGLQTISVQTETTSEIPDVTSDDCPFCFQYFKMSALETDAFLINALSGFDLFNNFVNEHALVVFHKSYQSRAPPVLS